MFLSSKLIQESFFKCAIPEMDGPPSRPACLQLARHCLAHDRLFLSRSGKLRIVESRGPRSDASSPPPKGLRQTLFGGIPFVLTDCFLFESQCQPRAQTDGS